jgi:uncharacterized membrane-anchored protein
MAATHLQLTKPPRREDLLRRIEAANRWCLPIALIQVAAIALLSYLINWQQAVAEPLVTTVAIGAIVGPFSMRLLRFWITKKKRIDDLQEQTRVNYSTPQKHLAKPTECTLR